MQDWQNGYFLSLFAAAILHGLFLALIIFKKPRKDTSHHWLSLALIGVSFVLINYFVFISGVIQDVPNLLNVFIPITYLTGPAFYLFIRKSRDKNFKPGWIDLIHLVPILWALWESAVVLQWPIEEKLRAVNIIFEGRTPTVSELLLGNRFIWITAFYVILGLYYLAPRRTLKISKDQVRTDWLRKFSIVFLSVLVGSVLIQVVFLKLGINGAYMELSLTLLYAIVIHILGYVILKHQKGTPWILNPRKYQTSPLNSTLLNQYKANILIFLERQRPWLNPNFSIDQMSSELSVPKHHLSQVLNEEMSVSFVDLVNSYRIEAAKSKLISGALEKYSMMGIAMDCGFTSKSTFNRTFKKFTGLTPSAYLEASELPTTVQ